MSDPALLAAYLGGSDAAFSTLVTRHEALVRQACRRVLAAEADCDDAAQATWLLLQRRARRLVHRRSLTGWLVMAAQLTARNLRRTRVRAARRDRHAAPARAPATTPPLAEEVGPPLAAAWARLPAPLREAVQATVVAGVPAAQAARALGMPRTTLVARVAEGLDRLRRDLERQGVAPAVITALDAHLQRPALSAGAAAHLQSLVAQVERQLRWRSLWPSLLALGAVVLAAVVLVGMRTTTGAHPAAMPTRMRAVSAASPPPPRPAAPPPATHQWDDALALPGCLTADGHWFLYARTDGAITAVRVDGLDAPPRVLGHPAPLLPPPPPTPAHGWIVPVGAHPVAASADLRAVLLEDRPQRQDEPRWWRWSPAERRCEPWAGVAPQAEAVLIPGSDPAHASVGLVWNRQAVQRLAADTLQGPGPQDLNQPRQPIAFVDAVCWCGRDLVWLDTAFDAAPALVSVPPPPASPRRQPLSGMDVPAGTWVHLLGTSDGGASILAVIGRRLLRIPRTAMPAGTTTAACIDAPAGTADGWHDPSWCIARDGTIASAVAVAQEQACGPIQLRWLDDHGHLLRHLEIPVTAALAALDHADAPERAHPRGSSLTIQTAARILAATRTGAVVLVTRSLRYAGFGTMYELPLLIQDADGAPAVRLDPGGVFAHLSAGIMTPVVDYPVFVTTPGMVVLQQGSQVRWYRLP